MPGKIGPIVEFAIRKHRSIVIAIAIGIWPQVNCHLCADVRLPHLLGDHAVLQRDMPIRIEGWADPGEHVTVHLHEHTAETTSNSDGKWQVTLPSMDAGGPYDLSVEGKNQLRIHDVLIGELWVCAGQSNMNWVMAHQTRNHAAEIAAANYPRMRLFTVPEKASPTPVEDIDSQWYACSKQSVSYFSAVAYYFGRELHQQLDVPVGLVVSAVSGTRIEPWTPEVGIESIPELKNQQQFSHGDLFRGMIQPLTPFTIRGVIWYQGEGNVGDGFVYYHRMRALVGGWRKSWGIGDFPFYYVQLAPLNWGGKPVDQLPEIWEAQTAALRIPNTGMAVTNDIGNIGDAHPRNKQDVGKRLANWALNKTYGRPDTPTSGPLYRSMKIEGTQIRIEFDYADDGLTTRDGVPPTWFTIAGTDGNFLPATAIIDGNSVVVSNSQVLQPTAVRFAWHQIAEPNLMNRTGLPVSAFRTDMPHTP